MTVASEPDERSSCRIAAFDFDWASTEDVKMTRAMKVRRYFIADW
jgi:hypothetical protein